MNGQISNLEGTYKITMVEFMVRVPTVELNSVYSLKLYHFEACIRYFDEARLVEGFVYC